MEPKKIKAKAMGIVVRNRNEILAALGFDPKKNEHFGRIIGGHIEFGETSRDTIQREFLEELGTKLENLTFIKVIENIFQYKGEPGHEIIFLYKGDLVDKNLYEKDEINMLDKDVKITWISLDDIKVGKIKLYPEFDYEELLKV